MKLKDHIKSYIQFWKPSVARRITFYFLLFSLIIFLFTSFLYMSLTRKHFIASTSKAIKHQLSLIEKSKEVDFIWNGIGKTFPELYQLFQTLINFSSSFYTVTDISIYVKSGYQKSWHRVFFDDNKILQAEPTQGPFVDKLDKSQRRHFMRQGKLLRSDKEHSLFINITGQEDKKIYFMKIGVDSESITGLMRNESIWLLLTFIIVMILSRFIGCYFARRISRPIEELSEFSSNVAKGDLSHLAPISSNDELGQLADNFNTMVEGLREWERIKKIEFELEKGREIQKEFLPNRIPNLPNWEIATCFYPAGKVSGDFYDIFALPGECVGLVIADVCDKGVGSALYMALFRSLIRVFSEQALSREINRSENEGKTSNATADLNLESGLRAVSFTNNYIAQNHGDDGMFATLFFGVLNPDTGRLCYVNGGHEPLYVTNKKGIQHELRPTGPAVGIMPDTAFNINYVQLEPGDIMIGYTDGVTEARSPDDEIFTRDRLKTLLSQPFQSASEMLERIKNNLFSFIDIAPMGDDVTILAIQRSLS